MALIKTKARGIANNAIGPDQFDLTANYPFTGTVSGTNGMTLLQSLNETTDTDYASDVEIFNIDSYTSTYHTFFWEFSMYLTGNGNCHCHIAVADASTTVLSCRTIGNGMFDQGSAATPVTGTGSYHRWASNAAGPNIVHSCAGYIFNGQRSDNDYDAQMQFQSNWHYSGVGQAFANHSMTVTASGDQISRFILNNDGGSSSAASDFNARVKGSIWGVA
tara:strand:+ start:247 stop:903 length:657 start_codon:yes stop_codon:yes gene_type:complete